MYYDPRVESKADHLCYVIFETMANNELTEEEKIDKVRSDVFLTLRSSDSYWKNQLDRELKENKAGRYNMVGVFLRTAYEPTIEDVRFMMNHMDMNGIANIRNLMYKRKKDDQHG